MAESILRVFLGEEKATDLLANPLIEFIFSILFVLFVSAVLVHLFIYVKLKSIRNNSNRTAVQPVSDMKDQFEVRQKKEEIKTETFVQEQFSEWRMLGFPIISLTKMVNATVSLFILIGVLGTFIGLTMSLSSISGGGDQLAENVAVVLAGVDVAFYTSIAGMGFSLIMTVLVKALNTEDMLTDIMLKVESDLEGAGERGMDRLITVSEGIQAGLEHLKISNEQSLQNVAEAFSGFQQYTTGLQQAASDLAQFNEGLGNNLQEFEALFYNMKSVTDGFSEGTQQLNNHFTSLFSYLKKMDAKKDSSLQAMESIQKDVRYTSEAQSNTLEHLQSSAADFETLMSRILKEQTSMQSFFKDINQQTGEHIQALEAQSKIFQQTFGVNVAGKISDMTTQLNGMKQGFNQISQSFVKLPDALDTIQHTQDEYRQLLTERFEDIKQFDQTFSDHLRSQEQGVRHLETNMQTTARTFDQMGRQNQQMLKDLNTVLGDINQRFSQRESQLEDRTDALSSVLTSFSDNLDESVGNKLESAAKGLNTSIKAMNDDIRKEYKALNKTAKEREDQHSSHLNQLQEMIKELIEVMTEYRPENVQRQSRPQEDIRYDNYEK